MKPGPKSKIKQLLLLGGEWTSAQLNREAETADSRKCISRLRSEGFPIKDREELGEIRDGHRSKFKWYRYEAEQ